MTALTSLFASTLCKATSSSAGDSGGFKGIADSAEN